MYHLDAADRFVIGWLIGQLPGVNRTDARIISSLDEKLKLGEVPSWKRGEEGDAEPFELTKIEVDWIRDHIDAKFKEQKVPPQLSQPVTKLDDYLAHKEEDKPKE
jgi:hypothetical protein